jgi:hypothetical protein
MFEKLINKRGMGGDAELAAKQVRVSIGHKGRKSGVDPSAVFSFGHEVYEKLGWKLKDRIDVQIDKKAQLFWFTKSPLRETGFLLSGSGGSASKSKSGVLKLSFNVNRERTPFINGSNITHPSVSMRFSYPSDGGVYVWYTR